MEKLVIPGEFPGLNEIIEASKTHYQKYRRLKKNCTELVMLRANRLPEMEKIKLDITYYRKNRRHDPDNIAAGKKFILDGLVAAGIIKNDGWKEVAEWEESWEVDKDKPRIEIKITEVSKENE